jgi:membrane-associated phospholipid phosphatase
MAFAPLALCLTWLGQAAPMPPTSPALEPPPMTASPLRVNLPVEYVLSAGTLVTTAILDSAVKMSLGGQMPCRTLDDGGRCDPAALWSLDRRSLSLHNRGWSVVSDVGQTLAIAGSAAGVIADALVHHRGRPGHDAAVDFAVLLESYAISTAVNQLLKFAVRRPRPQAYKLGTHRGVEAELSFPSGHTSAAASTLAAWSTIFALRHPHSPWRYAPYGIGAGVTGLVAYGRVSTPKHFASDVVAAAVLGGIIGFSVPMLHRTWPTRQLQLQLTAQAQGAPPVLALSGRLG